MNTSRPHPRAFMAWAHAGRDWTQDQRRAWREEVTSFCVLLRSLGVDVDADVFHVHERGIDWNVYGPREIGDREFVLVALSEPWKERWEGRNDPTVGAGAAAEANTLRGIFSRDQDAFRRKVILVELPSIRGTDSIPDELRGLQRFSIDAFSHDAVEDLLRLLTNQPREPLPGLGDIPILPPSRRGELADTPRVPLVQLADVNQRIEQLEAALARIHQPEASEGGQSAWQSVSGELRTLRAERQRLGIEVGDPPRAGEILERAPAPPGAPDRRMVYEGVLLLRVAMAAVPPSNRHATARRCSAYCATQPQRLRRTQQRTGAQAFRRSS